MSTYRVYWPCCDGVTETEAYEPEHCPFCYETPLEKAAPDLLEALRSTRLALLMMLSYHGQGSADYADAAQHRAGEAIDEASAAIAKATGEQA